MESTLKNMVLTLGIITLISSAAVGVVYNMTKEPIEAAKAAKTTDALKQVLPQFDGEPVIDSVEVNGRVAIVYTVSYAGQVVGYAVQSNTMKGFGGEIKLMTGFTPDGEIIKIQVLGHNETPGLGDKIDPKKSEFSVQFQGKSPATLKMSVRKDGGDIDAITASTISSRAYIDAVQHAWGAFLSVKNNIAPATDANSGATTQAEGQKGESQNE